MINWQAGVVELQDNQIEGSGVNGADVALVPLDAGFVSELYLGGFAEQLLVVGEALRKLGRDLALARRKRGISTADMAARLFVSRNTLWRLERGDATVALGTLATAAFVLQLHDRLANLAAPATDALALSLDEQRLPKRIRRFKP